MRPDPSRIASRYLFGGLRLPQIGDKIWWGKYRNKKGVIVGQGYDEHNIPTITVTNPDKPRSRPKILKLYPFRWAD